MRNIRVILYSIIWYVISVSDSYTNKVFYIHYPYPITISLAHFIVNSLLFTLLTSWRQVPQQATYTSLLPYIAGLGVMKLFVSVSAHTTSLMLTLAYSQTIKMLSPIFVLVLSKIIYGKSEPLYVYVSVVLMAVGVTVCTGTEHSLPIFGLVSCIGMVASSATASFFTKVYLTKFGQDSLSLARDIHLLALLFVIPLWIIRELPDILSNPHLTTGSEKIYFAKLFLLQGVFSFGTHWMKFMLLPMISSVSYVMIDSGKSIFKIVVSMLIYRGLHTLPNVLGVCVAVSGAVLYHTRREMTKQKDE